MAEEANLFRESPGEKALTFLRALLEGVVDLLEHGLAALLEGWQHHTLEGLSVGCLDGALQGVSCRPHNAISKVLEAHGEEARCLPPACDMLRCEHTEWLPTTPPPREDNLVAPELVAPGESFEHWQLTWAHAHLRHR